jgi:hypothetical protein
MNLTYEQIYSALPNLGSAERHRLFEALAHMLGVAVNETDPAAVAVGSLTSRELNDQWLAANADNYRGQWVALKDGVLIAHSSDGKAFVKAVKDSGVDCPFLLLIPLPKDSPQIANLKNLLKEGAISRAERDLRLAEE